MELSAAQQISYEKPLFDGAKSLRISDKELSLVKQFPGRYSGEGFAKGDYTKAWKVYGHREGEFWGPEGRKVGNLQRWAGQDLKGKHIVLGSEQAMGEQIMFAGFIPLLLEAGAKVTCEVEPRLVTLFQRSFPDCNIVPFGFNWDPKLYEGDYFTLIGNVARAFIKDKSGFNQLKRKYLKAISGQLPSRLLHVGLSWTSPNKTQNSTKDVPFEVLRPLYETFECVNLQFGAEPPKELYTDENVDLVQDVDGVAGLIQACDVVVTISNTVAHIAGALGKPTYLLLSNGKLKHWYWDQGFYPSITRIEAPSARLFETKPGWEEKINEIRNLIIKST